MIPLIKRKKSKLQIRKKYFNITYFIKNFYTEFMKNTCNLTIMQIYNKKII